MAANKKTLLEQGLKLLSNPRIIKLMQDERVMKTLVAAMSLPGKAQSFAKDQMENESVSMHGYEAIQSLASITPLVFCVEEGYENN